MMTMKVNPVFRFFLFCLSMWAGLTSNAQSSLSLEEAITLAVAKNHAIVIARNQEEAAKYARNIGNAGMLPSISVDGSAVFSNVNIHQELSSGVVASQSGARSDQYSAAVRLDWVLFDGLNMFANYGVLTQLKNQSMINTRIQIENTIAQVMRSYFNIVRDKQVLLSIRENISVSEERVRIAEQRLVVGSGTKTDLLQARIDLNAFRSQLNDQEILIYDSKTALNDFIGRDPATEFEVSDSIVPGAMLEQAKLREEAGNNNSRLKFEERNIDLQKYYRRQVDALRYPTFALNTSYSFNRSENQAGLFRLNQNYGFYGGFSIFIPIFDGWKVNTRRKLATINMYNAQLSYKQVQDQTDIAVLRSYKRYESAIKQLEVERETVEMAKENITLSLGRFRQGISNSLELREAQKSYVEAMTRLMNALYSIKIQEIELMMLTGAMVR